jgi:hypothetical protein
MIWATGSSLSSPWTRRRSSGRSKRRRIVFAEIRAAHRVENGGCVDEHLRPAATLGYPQNAGPRQRRTRPLRNGGAVGSLLARTRVRPRGPACVAGRHQDHADRARSAARARAIRATWLLGYVAAFQAAAGSSARASKCCWRLAMRRARVLPQVCSSSRTRIQQGLISRRKG